jgi:ubiquinone/menaquinone biosynthesis C-methylase UbiE
MFPFLLLAAALILIALLAYWELVIVEGAHLGAGVVVWLYDLVAGRYDRIKQFDLEVEGGTLGLPLAAALAELDEALVLDVAAGTGRVARALLREPAFDGRVVNLDLSARMLAQGRRAVAAPGLPDGEPDRLDWVRGPAAGLPFAAETFDAVTCLEALEFVPDVRAALAECLRVLRPGGLLLVSNRIGRDAWLMPGKTLRRPAFEQLLRSLPLCEMEVVPWQVEYDLAWCLKNRV